MSPNNKGNLIMKEKEVGKREITCLLHSRKSNLSIK